MGLLADSTFCYFLVFEGQKLGSIEHTILTLTAVGKYRKYLK